MLVSLAQIAKEMNLKEDDHVMIEERDDGNSYFLFLEFQNPKSISGQQNGKRG